MTASERLLLAFHESGHVVCGLLCGYRVESARINDGTQQPLAQTTYAGRWKRTQCSANLVRMLAGPMAEAIYTGRDILDVLAEGSEYEASDLQRARREAVRLAHRGLYKTPDHALLAAEAKARELLLKHWGSVIATARELHRHGRID